MFYTEVPAQDFDVILGRPSADRVTVSVLAYDVMEAYIVYGGNADELNRRTPVRILAQGKPEEIVLPDLTADTRYHYRIHWRRPGADTFQPDELRGFHTQRRRGAPFTFTVQADSHLDHPQGPELYTRTLRSALGDVPDFHIDLGDTFMTDKRRQDHTQAFPQYLAQRYYFSLLCHSAPLFLVLGNHDGESGQRPRNKEGDMAAWSNTLRTRHFPNPVPDKFYTGNGTPFGSLGLLQDYYAWEWGDALFVVLDPYWFTTGRARESDRFWEKSLGKDQYDWLATTLADSRAPFKFVFIHNLVGGNGSSMRGGAEAAKYFEWGGHDLNGRYAFEERRPGWSASIHELLKHHDVTAVFHGHDHFFARQELDGITYQLVPQPAHPGGRDVERMAAEYGYVEGDFLPSPGYLRVTVGNDVTTVCYVYTGRSRGRNDDQDVPKVAFEYRLPTNAQEERSAERVTGAGADAATSATER